MFKQMSLKAKLLMVAALPFFAYLIMVGIKINDNWGRLVTAETTNLNIDLMQASSGFVHEFQKERAKTVAYLGKSTDLSDLNAQRSLTDKKQDDFKRALDKAPDLSKKLYEDSYKAAQELGNIRTRVTSYSIEGKDAIKYFSDTVASLIDSTSGLSAISLVVGIPVAIRSTAILETAKESAGRLRANTIASIVANAPLDAARYKALSSLKEGVDLDLKSHGLAVSSESKKKIANFRISDNWTKTVEVVEFVLKNSDKGNYNQDSKAFYNYITAAIDDLADIVNTELQASEDKVTGVLKDASAQLWSFSLIGSIFALGLISVLIYTVRGITNSVTATITDLTASSSAVASASVQLLAASQQLSSSTTESAASLQETAASLDEVLAMTDKNSENAKRSQSLSSESTTAVKQGRSVVDDMIGSINDISNSTKGIMEAVETSNREISEIVKVIGDIGEKTKVINDIVFQTKLLSFNASVEAARAGEHGKGFAVVAEEVGNLAQMSGNAAKEITAMLSGSIVRVQDIVNSTKTRVERLVVESREKVDAGTTTAGKCREALDKISDVVEQVESMVNEIAHASQEQSRGISEINRAMGQLDTVTQQNSTVAHQCSGSSSELNGQSDQLKNVVGQLHRLLNGNDNEMTWHSEKTNYTPTVARKEPPARKVIPLAEAKKPATRPVAKTDTTKQPVDTYKADKKVSGDTVAVPSGNDPRFEDV